MVFEDVVGQSHVTTTLRNAIASNRLSHAYLFSGARGVGKTSTARILAKAINCLHPREFDPDNECELCKEITEGRSVNVFEIDGASNRGVEDVRNLRDAVRYGPAKGKYKVYIIDEVHMLTKEAFNALLKTLEEPPSYILFIFATTEVHKVPLTILSRCQRFDFRRMTIEEIVSRLRFIAGEESIAIDDDTLFIIAKKADGSMRDAQSIFDQLVSFCGDKITAKQIIQVLNIVDQELFFHATDLIRAKDTKGILALVEEIISHGYDLREFLNGLNEHFRNMLVVNSTGATALIEASDVQKKRYQEDSKSFSENDLLRLITVTTQTASALRWNQQPRYTLEIGLLQMIKMDSSIEIQQLLARLEDLKKRVGGKPDTSDAAPLPREKLETPIRGSVKATPPSLRPDQIVSPRPMLADLPPPYRQSRPLRTSDAEPPPIPSTAEELPRLSVEDVRAKWSTLIDQTRKERIDLWAFLGESKPLEIRGDKLQIACPDNFHLDTFRRNRDYISQLAQKVYGGKVKLEAILSSAPPLPLEKPDNNSEKKGTLQHPVIQALIREFGAEPVE
jgi:DNA polymerase-3 subunit gamma/tau